MTKREMFENILDKGATEYSICDIQELKGFAHSFQIQIEEKDKEIVKLNKEIMQLKEQIVSAIRCNNLVKEQATLVQEQARIYEQELIFAREKQLKEEIIKLNNTTNGLENWLKSEIERITKLKNPKKGVKPYGKEKEFYDIMINSYTYCLNKLKELKEGD